MNGTWRGYELLVIFISDELAPPLATPARCSRSQIRPGGAFIELAAMTICVD